MNIDIISGSLGIFFLVWIILHFQERRRVFNGLVFFGSMASFLLLIIYIGMVYDMQYLVIFSSVVIVLIGLSIPLLTLALIYILFSTGKELVEKEGLSLSHVLSFILGIGIIGSLFVLPFIENKLDYKIVKILSTFFLSIFSYFVIGFIIYYTASIIYKLAVNKKNKDYLIVLGSGLDKDKVTPLLAGRIDGAINFYRLQKEKNNKKLKIVMSGGQGPNELVPEALAMKNYAMEQGIEENDILCEDKSVSTEENLIFSKKIISEDSNLKNPKVLFFTSNYHVFRASLIARKEGLNYHGMGVPVKLYFYVSAVIREYIAVLVMNKKLNLILLSIFVFFSVVAVL